MEREKEFKYELYARSCRHLQHSWLILYHYMWFVYNRDNWLKGERGRLINNSTWRGKLLLSLWRACDADNTFLANYILCLSLREREREREYMVCGRKNCLIAMSTAARWDSSISLRSPLFTRQIFIRSWRRDEKSPNALNAQWMQLKMPLTFSLYCGVKHYLLKLITMYSVAKSWSRFHCEKVKSIYRSVTSCTLWSL